MRALRCCASALVCLPLLGVPLLAGCDQGTIAPCASSSCDGPPPATKKATSTTINVTPADVTAGSPVTFTSSVTPGNVQGGVTFLNVAANTSFGGALVYSSPVSVVGAPGRVGSFRVAATFTPIDNLYSASTSAPVPLVVRAAGAVCGLGPAVYALGSGTAAQTAPQYAAAAANGSAVCVTGPQTALTLQQPVVTTAGVPDTFEDLSGLGAAVLAYEDTAAGASVVLNGGSVTTTGYGADALFASGPGTSVTANGTVLNGNPPGGTNGSGTYDRGDHVAGAARGGSVHLNTVSATNMISSGALLFTQGGGSSVTVTGGVLNVNALLAEMDDASSIQLNGVTVVGGVSGSGGGGTVFSSSAIDGVAVGAGSFTMTGGSYSAQVSSLGLFYVSNKAGAAVTLDGVSLSLAKGGLRTILIDVEAASPGATANFGVHRQTLAGDVQTANGNIVNYTLSDGSAWTGTTSQGVGTAGVVNLTLDAGSTWTVTADTAVDGLVDAAGISGTAVKNIVGNGHTVFYKAAASPGLGGLTYALVGGGVLKPG